MFIKVVVVILIALAMWTCCHCGVNTPCSALTKVRL